MPVSEPTIIVLVSDKFFGISFASSSAAKGNAKSAKIGKLRTAKNAKINKARKNIKFTQRKLRRFFKYKIIKPRKASPAKTCNKIKCKPSPCPSFSKKITP